ncbi:MAG: 23S rRNA (pseudouridine(1915)-N(3))-methyltransferase RlmH [Actinobacteria bacterium]|nr:23S rRNA (pseudouridine(1915)-N(3))-methyltransferase RlmH [Actinomycetota bacterium]
MDILILAVGKLKEDYLRLAAAEYAERLARYARVSTVEVPEEAIASRPERSVKSLEAERVLSRIPEGYHVIALDRLGKEMTSEELAAYIEKQMTAGASRFAFVVGGPLGLDDEVLTRANLRLSLSRLTLTHQLARIFLLEQVYRSFKIIRKEPYHY